MQEEDHVKKVMVPRVGGNSMNDSSEGKISEPTSRIHRGMERVYVQESKPEDEKAHWLCLQEKLGQGTPCVANRRSIIIARSFQTAFSVFNLAFSSRNDRVSRALLARLRLAARVFCRRLYSFFCSSVEFGSRGSSSSL